MDETKILHIMILDKFLAPFIDFVDEHFGREGHHYVFVTSERYEYGLTREHKVEFLHTNDDIFVTLLKYMEKAQKIILHGLWRDKVDMLLYFNPQILKKCYWIMWGGDFYFPEKQSWFKKEVIKKIGHCLPIAYGDYAYIQTHYDSRAVYHECLNYPRCILIENIDTLINKNDEPKKVLVGNSATSTNFHTTIFDKLRNKHNIEIYVPLSYGDAEYAKEVIVYGTAIFKENFFPLTEFMEPKVYQNFLSTIDIALFKHNRQQAVGNITSLLGMGKTVYLSKDATTWEMFTNLGLVIKDIDECDELTQLTVDEAVFNQKKVSNYFTETRAANLWKEIFNHE